MFTTVAMRTSSTAPGVYLTCLGVGAISGDVMPHEVECTHCHVLMTSWSAAGSPVRYWQCPFCGRNHSSLYSEVFERGAGARRVEPVSVAAGPGAPQASPEEIQRGRLKARAAQWFARLEQEQVAVPPARGGPRSIGSASPPLRATVAAGARRSR
jgi:hypothetical protein